ncbi:LOW QUALITY PROTEIN: DNA repair-scaffolding protein-like [Nycticebus coucang]|uniref:LOW QUALITY PROTEIN: DNA repair-scaffolding protein-like n=1 Tax=Nycticebus coucang TaxID=9470 RepID=UPI00234D2AAF|nr:LOW QUALITY PROTEIN: DNA repair-scaffolding protein-like [Nycticebus coucang]
MEFGSNATRVTEKLGDSRASSAKTVLCSPQKQTTKFSRTPENSAKKKLLRGGLAERLNGLQNRERSAISLWRHQCVSYQKTLSGKEFHNCFQEKMRHWHQCIISQGRKSGVLTVRILELHEECTMHIAMCEQLAGPLAAGPSGDVAPTPAAHLRVLFTKETAGYLRGHPQDIVHIFPPWQKLIIPDGSCPIILNTYFCQKIVAKGDSETTHEVYCQDAPPPRRSISLAQMFRIQNLTNKSPDSQVICNGVATTGTEQTHESIQASVPLRDFLLDMVESQGAQVQVVVQKMRSLPGRDSARSQKGDSLGHTEPPRARVCLLVQDTYGMFGEVHLEAALLKGRQLEGKSCSLEGVKILRHAARGRQGNTAGLFSLIDSLWPPAIPLKAPATASLMKRLTACQGRGPTTFTASCTGLVPTEAASSPVPLW